MNKQIVVNGLLLNYLAFEKEGAGKTVIFLHGWRSEAKVWQGIVNQLISQSAHQQISFYALDLPGFGQSQIPKKTMAVGDYAEIVAEFIKKLDLKNIIMVGHSFGGRIGIKLASVNPEIITKLVLVDSAGFAMASDKKSAIKLAAKIVKPFFKPKFMQGLRKLIYKQIGAEDYLATPELQQTFVNIVGEDLSADMKNIHCPTLIVTGENDTDTPVEFGKKMQMLILKSEFVVLPNAGHFSFLDKPNEFVKELSKFISL